jgi:surface antigen
MRSRFSIQPLTIFGTLTLAFLIAGILGCADQNNTVLPGDPNERNTQIGESVASPDVSQEIQSAPAQNPFQWGWCTWYAADKWLKWGYGLPSTRNAKDWFDDARKKGYPTGQQPRERAIMVLEGGNWPKDPKDIDPRGHVAIVDKVKGNQFQVSEMNWNGNFGKVTTRPPLTVGKVNRLKGFVYPKK